jgi:predicted HicB family RNase H-like nuclease
MDKNTPKRGRGRPKLDPKSKGSKLIALRLAPAELKAYKRAAKQTGQGLSEWIRANLERAAGLSKQT